MGDRFVVVPVDGGKTADRPGSVKTQAARLTGGDGRDEEPELEEDALFEPQDPNAAVPILEYNREPNKYGESAGPLLQCSAPLLISCWISRVRFTRAWFIFLHCGMKSVMTRR